MRRQVQLHHRARDPARLLVALHTFPGRTGRALKAATIVAVNVAREEARERGKTYYVTLTPQPTAAVYVFACDRPDAGDPSINVRLELTPSGERIRHPGFRTSARR